MFNVTSAVPEHVTKCTNLIGWPVYLAEIRTPLSIKKTVELMAFKWGLKTAPETGITSHINSELSLILSWKIKFKSHNDHITIRVTEYSNG